MSKYSASSPLLIGEDGIVRDHMGFPLPMSEVKDIVLSITATYWGMSPGQLQQEYERRLNDFPGMKQQIDVTKVDLS